MCFLIGAKAHHPIVGLCLDLSDDAVLLRVNEKSWIQAFARIRPPVPMGLGQVERYTLDHRVSTAPTRRSQVRSAHLARPAERS